jgi:hypothetical protein
MAREFDNLLNGSPFSQYQRVTVVFNATGGLDTVIPHTLKVTNPDAVQYTVLGMDRAGSIYHDQSATRKPWGAAFIVLRASVASLQATLLLTLPRTV